MTDKTCDNCAFENCDSFISKAEIEELNIELKAMRGVANFYKEYCQNLQTANTALSNEILEAKSEAVKEFVERLKKKSVYAHGFGFAVALNKIQEALYEWSKNEP